MTRTGGKTGVPRELGTGLWVGSTDARVVRAAAGGGFDWACVDEQHGGAAGGRENTDLIAAVRAAGVPAFVRVAWNRPELIGRALDSGADGVVVPMVDSVEQARAAAAATRFAPRGTRSFGPIRSVDGVAIPAPEQANADVLCLVMVETVRGLDAVDDIAAVDGVDGVFIGPFDLSLALGLDVAGLLADDGEDGPLRRVVRACRARGLVAGAYAGSPERVARLRAAGFTMIAAVDDLAMIARSAGEAAAAAKAR
ncbi:HpcH/HpaI aldolase family protein [Saccharothrix yanglingensis]|uniref:Aldolase n=1 Tax=Saccharothrix yanglingensis TaxID=659496 RepID=A0ABU0X6Y5_9PSEU|nr:aldolase/citrate lyase family protein [Saccharothrix yanglingensis]MDQ2587889.1 aldolase [Saccharothrix yanglingensis]